MASIDPLLTAREGAAGGSIRSAGIVLWRL